MPDKQITEQPEEEIAIEQQIEEQREEEGQTVQLPDQIVSQPYIIYKKLTVEECVALKEKLAISDDGWKYIETAFNLPVDCSLPNLRKYINKKQ